MRDVFLTSQCEAFMSRMKNEFNLVGPLDSTVTTVTMKEKEAQMPKNKRKKTPGQKLWLSLYRADLYDKEAEKIEVPHGAPKLNAEGLTKRWLEGMSRQLKNSFPAGLRKYREELGLTQ